ncbi:hypothetical protein VTJ49DRAFT_2133 [Mycothermus thermophilus]|uniref:Extracellular mutant protein 11 C-terminal domain-containing protein n=1 Tax=Humicola insolens TaxID=85995 RepID=A0ABR3VQV5_HUMIN
MGLRMMPTTKKKLGSIGIFMRQGDSSNGSTSNPRAGGGGGAGLGAGLSVISSPVPIPISGGGGPGSGSGSGSGHATNGTNATHASGHSHLPLPLSQLQPPLDVVAAKQERLQQQQQTQTQQNGTKQQQQHSPTQQGKPDTPATARSIPPPRAGRFSASSQPVAMSFPTQQLHIHPLHRSKTSASDPSARETRDHHNAWEDSTVASMFGGESEGKPASDRLRVHHQGSHARHYSDIPPPNKALPQPPTSRTLSQRRDENLPFVISNNGLLEVLPPSSLQPSNLQKAPETAIPVPAATSTHGSALDDQSVQNYDGYGEPRPFDTPTKATVLRRTRLAYREKGEHRRNPSSERGGPAFSPRSQVTESLSPERRAEAAGHLEKLRLQERTAREKERQREQEREREMEKARERQRQTERELENKRSTLFENLTPFDAEDVDFNNTKAAVVEPTIKFDADELSDALERTPRAHHERAIPRPLFAPPPKLNLPETAPPLARTGSRRAAKDEPIRDSQTLGAALQLTSTSAASRKRPRSPDYNDAELASMSYEALRDQDFEFDPQTAAMQQQPPPQLAPPQGGALADRLAHYKTKGSMDQHEFLARLPIDEWDEAGDWFLEQFTSVVSRLREARRARRRLVRQFEDEVAARAEAVRLKAENIDRTLEELKEEGQTMMEGKDVDMEF